MQQTLFKRKFSVLLNAVKTENVQHLQAKIQPIKNIVIKKIQKKKIASNLNFKKTSLIFEGNLFNVSLLQPHTKFGISMTSCLGVICTESDKFTNTLFVKVSFVCNDL